MLPKKTSDGHRVILFKLINSDPSAFNFADACKSFTMWTDLDLYWNGTSDGFVIVLDLDGVVFGEWARVTKSLHD